MKTRITDMLVRNSSRLEVNRSRTSAVLFCLALGAILTAQSGYSATPFPPQGDDTTPSMGVFRIIVDPLFRPLLSPTGPPTSFSGYIGFHTSDGRLTSPMLVDSATTIGRSNPNSRLYAFPQPLGAGSWDTILGYGDYPAIPFLWAAAPSPTEEVLTEIKSFVLRTVSGSTGEQCRNPMLPSAPPNYPMVRAGTFAGVSPRSLGIVQENVANGPPFPDFPARSFFDIFVLVNLPPLPGTESSVAFPPGGAILTNGTPLIITNLDLTSFPPQVVYIHGGNTNAVELRFKFGNPPYWAAGDLFGTIALAGHGTFTNDCSQEDALVAAVLGTTNAPMPETPQEWLRNTTLAPSPGSAYESLLTDTNPPSSSDTLLFTITGQGTFYARDFRESNFPNPINLPPPNGSATYTGSNVVVTFYMSLDQHTWGQGQATGDLTVKMSNTTSAGSSMSTFDTEILQMNLTGVGPFSPVKFRQSTTMQSLGKHTIRSDPRGYRIGSFFDVFTELSTDGGSTYIPANRSIRMQASSPPAAPGTLFISSLPTGGEVLLQWLGPFTLQGAPKVTGTYTDMGTAGGSLLNSFTFRFGPDQMYFRLRQ